MMLCSGLSSTLLLAATCSLITSGFIRAQVSPPVTPISTGRVVTSNGLSVPRLSCVGGMIIVRSAEYRCGGEVICSHGDAVNNVRNSCDGKTECDIKSNITYDPGVCKYLETTYDCFPRQSVICGGSQANLQCAPSCPAGWTRFGGRCFIFNSSMKTWTDAECSCQTLGGNLASYHSTAEYTFIRELTRTAAGSYLTAWVGGNDRENETVWKWSDGSQFDFTNWGNGEPDNSGGGQDCMEINFNGRDYVNDQRCNSQRGFVCVRDTNCSFVS
nr:type-2 ice-structuring protein [Maylandia zebra]